MGFAKLLLTQSLLQFVLLNASLVAKHPLRLKSLFTCPSAERNLRKSGVIGGLPGEGVGMQASGATSTVLLAMNMKKTITRSHCWGRRDSRFQPFFQLCLLDLDAFASAYGSRAVHLCPGQARSRDVCHGGAHGPSAGHA
jgi:hypothetical protein